MAEDKIFRKTHEAVETKGADGADRILIVTISTNRPDSSKDIVLPEGIEAGNNLTFQSSPCPRAGCDRKVRDLAPDATKYHRALRMSATMAAHVSSAGLCGQIIADQSYLSSLDHDVRGTTHLDSRKRSTGGASQARRRSCPW